MSISKAPILIAVFGHVRHLAARGIEFYQEIGRLGGQRVRDLIAAGRKAERGSRRGTSRRGRNQFAPDRGV